MVAKAQPGKEAWHWRFGSKCGMEFSSGTPLQETGLPVSWQFPYSAASISDANTGQYLFSTNGIKVFNKNNTVMYNGFSMPGSIESCQHIIVPKPDSTNVFYVITTDEAKMVNNGVRYSVVDMSQQGGLGAVTIKNQLLTPGPTTERVTAVRHCNGKDYWVLTHPANSNDFNAYLITKNGINLSPVVSQAGTVQQYLSIYSGTTRYREGFGVLKASPNGKKLAIGLESDSLPILEIYDFDNSTGVVSNPITINYPGRMGPWGCSFSPDNSKLYSIPHSRPTFDTTFVYQYDLSSGVPATIIASQTLVFQMVHSTNGYMNFLCLPQMAPDGKIYVTRHLTDTIAVINNPNSPGLSCNFQYPGPILPGTISMMSFPNFIDANYAGIQLNVPDVQQCNSFTVALADAGPGYSTYQWSTGATTQTISVTSPGQYWVTVTNDQGCQRTDTIGAYVLVGGKTDTVACDMFHANVTQGGVIQYNWYDNTNNPIYDFTNSGVYWVDIAYVTGCGIRDSFDVTVVPSPQIDIGSDSTFCKGNLLMNAACSTCNYLWSTGATTPSIVATTAANYWVNVTDANGCTDADTLVVKPELTAFNFEMPNIVTPNDDNINDVIDFGKYQFAELQIDIFNRWGQKIFSGSTPDAIWKPEGEDGTYFYTAQYRIDCGTDSKTKELKGYITLVR